MENLSRAAIYVYIAHTTSSYLAYAFKTTTSAWADVIRTASTLYNILRQSVMTIACEFVRFNCMH